MADNQYVKDKGAMPVPASSRPPAWAHAPQEQFREALRTRPGARPFDQVAEETGARRQMQSAMSKGGRVVAKPDTDPARQRAADQWNKAFRRELTAQEYGQLSDSQKQLVAFNTDLVHAYDTDMASAKPQLRENTRAVIEALGLDRATEQKAVSGLGRTLGPAVRYDDLFGPGGAPMDKPEVTDKDRLVTAIRKQLGAYTEATAAKREQTQQAAVSDALANISFETPQAQADYEASLGYLLDPANIAKERWTAVAGELKSAGYNPEDFKKYALNLVSLSPPGAGQVSADQLTSWFGGS